MQEILTLKSGRVQHSPTEKSAPEPGPWSPVYSSLPLSLPFARESELVLIKKNNS